MKTLYRVKISWSVTLLVIRALAAEQTRSMQAISPTTTRLDEDGMNASRAGIDRAKACT